MNTYRRALIDYWIEIGKLKKVRKYVIKNLETGEYSPDPKSPWVYIFIREDGEHHYLSYSWNEFFEMFNLYNKVAFDEKLMRPEYSRWQPFDPWRNIFFREDINQLADITQDVLEALNESKRTINPCT